MNIQEEIIIKLIQEKAQTRADFRHVVASVYRNHNTAGYDSNIALRRAYDLMLESGDIEANENLEKLLVTKKMRSLSGVSVITVLTKPYPCPGKCIYCPSIVDVPKSYLPDEPAVMRAILNDYDAKKQVQTRLSSLAKQGHPVDKVELIVIGGTFSHLPRDYQEEFVKNCFDALNGVDSATLDEAKEINETAKSRCVGLTLETRPDHIDEDEVKWFRYLGATRVELGVQTVFDDILAKNNRGEKVADTIGATKLLRDAGFKICYHLMPNLYGSDIEMDKKMFQEVFTNPNFRPDYIKIYPCMVLKNTPLYDLWQNGEYISYSDEELTGLICWVKKHVPYWVRIMRTIRDIPASNIESGSKMSNMRQKVLGKAVLEGWSCKCIRCREIGDDTPSSSSSPTSQLNYNLVDRGSSNVRLDSRLRSSSLSDEAHPRVDDGNDGVLFVEEYEAAGGKEYFLSFETPDRAKIYSLLRLRLVNYSSNVSEKSGINSSQQASNNKKIAIIRELHTYGQQAEIGESGKTQHRGLGKKLIIEAEKIAARNDFKKISVISGVGVRDYYRKLGYDLDNEYMVKTI